MNSGTHIALSQRDTEDEIEEKDPDVIPVNKGMLFLFIPLRVKQVGR